MDISVGIRGLHSSAQLCKQKKNKYFAEMPKMSLIRLKIRIQCGEELEQCICIKQQQQQHHEIRNKNTSAINTTDYNESIALRMRDYRRNEISAKWLRLYDAFIQSVYYLCIVDIDPLTMNPCEMLLQHLIRIRNFSVNGLKFNTKQYYVMQMHISNTMGIQFGYTVCDWFVNEFSTIPINDKPYTTYKEKKQLSISMSTVNFSSKCVYSFSNESIFMFYKKNE